MTGQDQILSEDIVRITPQQWGLFFGLSVMGMLAFFLYTMALYLICPTIHSFIQSFQIVISFGLQILIMKEMASPLTICGGSLVFVSVVAISLEDFVVEKFPRKIQTYL